MNNYMNKVKREYEDNHLIEGNPVSVFNFNRS